MERFNTRNIIKWRNQICLVEEDDGNTVRLVPFNTTNTYMYPFKSWPPKDRRFIIQPYTAVFRHSYVYVPIQNLAKR